MQSEIVFLCRRAVRLDIIVYGISIPFLGVTLSFGLGLLLGTVILWVSLLLLCRSVSHIAAQAMQSAPYDAKRHLANYLLRMLVFAAAFAAAWRLASAAALGVALPMLYPRLIYTAEAIVGKWHTSGRGGTLEHL